MTLEVGRVIEASAAGRAGEWKLAGVLALVGLARTGVGVLLVAVTALRKGVGKRKTG